MRITTVKNHHGYSENYYILQLVMKFKVRLAHAQHIYGVLASERERRITDLTTTIIIIITRKIVL